MDKQAEHQAVLTTFRQDTERWRTDDFWAYEDTPEITEKLRAVLVDPAVRADMSLAIDMLLSINSVALPDVLEELADDQQLAQDRASLQELPAFIEFLSAAPLQTEADPTYDGPVSSDAVQALVVALHHGREKAEAEYTDQEVIRLSIMVEEAHLCFERQQAQAAARNELLTHATAEVTPNGLVSKLQQLSPLLDNQFDLVIVQSSPDSDELRHNTMTVQDQIADLLRIHPRSWLAAAEHEIQALSVIDIKRLYGASPAEMSELFTAYRLLHNLDEEVIHQGFRAVLTEPAPTEPTDTQWAYARLARYDAWHLYLLLSRAGKMIQELCGFETRPFPHAYYLAKGSGDAAHKSVANLQLFTSAIVLQALEKQQPPFASPGVPQI